MPVQAVDGHPGWRGKLRIIPYDRGILPVHIEQHPHPEMRRVRLDIRKGERRLERPHPDAGLQILGAVWPAWQPVHEKGQLPLLCCGQHLQASE